MAAVVFSMRHKARKAGWFLAFLLMAYMPIRFLFDFLRVADVTYGDLTPGQYAAIGLFGLGAWLMFNLRKQAEVLTPDSAIHIFQDGSPAWVEEKTMPKASKPSKKSKKSKRR
jgi:prolipoprotein diacylglyceryltransferase